MIRFPEEFTPSVAPKVLLIYLDMDFQHLSAETDDLFDHTSTSEESSRMLHLRPLLGLQYIAAATRSVGVEAVILDDRLMAFDAQSIARYAIDHGILMIGFYSSLAQTKITAEFIRELKRHSDVPAVVGGPGYVDYSILLDAGVDAVVRGEGESTAIDIVARLNAGQSVDWAGVPGIAHLQGGIYCETGTRDLLDPNLIPHPVRDNFVPPTEYRDYFLPGFRPNFVTMFASRGCPYRCTFCDSPNIWSNTVRRRTPDNVLAEIDEAVNRWDVRTIDMLDDVFGIGYHWIEEFCTKLAERRYDLRYKALMNPNTFGANQSKALAMLAHSGCDTVGIGMQTADMDTLHFIQRKADTPEHLIDAVSTAKKNGILTFVNFIVGFPGEPANAAEQIMKLIDRAKPHLIDCYGLLYIKGTALYAKRQTGEVENNADFGKRFHNAERVRRHFYTNPINLLRFFFWLVRRNPYWLMFMLGKSRFFLSFLFSDFAKKKPN